MENKSFNGKAIYQPKGKAGEYAKWACNFYIGCSNNCSYCYCKKGMFKYMLGDNFVSLKSCFKSEEHALYFFEKEFEANYSELNKHGLFFSFTTDPMLKETKGLTEAAMHYAIYNNVPIKILTKRAEWVDFFIKCYENYECVDIPNAKKMVAVGFTLTGHDELEPNASTNAERIKAMRKLHAAGFKTWASIEPIIDFESAKDMIKKTLGFCDLYKIGLMSGKKYDIHDAQVFVEWLREIPEEPKIYIKESLQKLTRYTTEELDDNFVGRDYNLFNY